MSLTSSAAMDGQANPLIGNKTKTPTHTLIRVRNNQRQHRQRRREYIESLERRLKATEETARRLGIENKALRNQVSSRNPQQWEPSPPTAMAVSDTDIAPYLASMDTYQYPETWHQPSQTRVPPSGSAIPRTAVTLQPGWTPPQAPTDPSNSTWTKDKSSHLLPPSVRAIPSPNATLPPPHIIQPAPKQPFTCCWPPPPPLHLSSAPPHWRVNQAPRPFPSPEISISATTLCAQAYLIIQHQNRRGLSSEVIESWLWPGFICGDESDEIVESGCRVDSRLLLGLLVYIAGDSDVETRTLWE